MACYSKNVTEYLCLFDLTYAIGNSARFVALSISDKGISVKDEAFFQEIFPFFLLMNITQNS
jgi:hypothetical protein